MEQKEFHKRFGDKSIMAPFKCGHLSLVYYNGEATKIARLSQAERSLCPKCKEKKLKRENVHIFIPYRYYKEHLINARNIIKGEYDKSNNTIELWLPQARVDEFVAESKRRYYQILNTPIKSNRSVLTICIKGNTMPVKDQLKALGAKWSGKQWIFAREVTVEIDRNNNVWIPPNINKEYYDLIEKLEKLGCIADYSKITW